jgi:dTDP-4-dehydrorhamnose 3,5-epimerase
LKISETSLAGAYVIQPELLTDERGFFARTFCRAEFARLDLDTQIEQCNISFNVKKGTLRGLHYQIAPHAETKIVRCTMGAMYDVVVDLRPGSPTLHQWIAVELNAHNRTMLYIPKGFAHGFQTLADNTEVLYQMSTPYVAEAARGILWDDPLLAVQWPLPSHTISEKDRTYPLLEARDTVR